MAKKKIIEEDNKEEIIWQPASPVYPDENDKIYNDVGYLKQSFQEPQKEVPKWISKDQQVEFKDMDNKYLGSVIRTLNTRLRTYAEKNEEVELNLSSLDDRIKYHENSIIELLEKKTTNNILSRNNKVIIETNKNLLDVALLEMSKRGLTLEGCFEENFNK